MVNSNYQNLNHQPLVQVNSNNAQNNVNNSKNKRIYIQPYSYKQKLEYEKGYYLNGFISSLYYISIFATITFLIMLFTLHLTNTLHLTIAQLGLYASGVSWGLSILAIICSIYFWIRYRMIKIK